MPYCQTDTLVKQSGADVLAKPLKCRCWHCPECAVDNLRRLRWRIRRGKPDMFLTLTIARRSAPNRHEAARRLRHGFAMLRQAIKRRWKLEHFPFIAVFEEHADGWPHLHILCRMRFIPQRWIAKKMRKLIGSPVVDVRRITTARAVVSYVTKYISKAPARFGGCKRYWGSHDWEVEQVPDRPVMPEFEGGWVRTKRWVFSLIDAHLAKGGSASFDAGFWRLHDYRGPPI